MNLHDLAPKVIRRLVWLYPYGGNGTPLGNTHGAHLYEVERGAPPPIREDLAADPFHHVHYQRRTWQPYDTRNFTPEQVVNPLCGRIRTRARFPYLGNAWGAGNCQECLNRAQGGEPATIGELQRDDPWQQIDWGVRGTTIGYRRSFHCEKPGFALSTSVYPSSASVRAASAERVPPAQ